jgi:phosphoglycerate-specific signal transduction histidine kinase
MDIDNVVEQTRILSLLSERYHVVRRENQVYACFAGIVLPVELGHVVFLWALLDAKYYTKLLIKRMEEIRQLNIGHLDITDEQTADDLAHYLRDRMRCIMRTWQAEHFEDVYI